ncbi:UvrD-helicase domain-containing protein [Polymorphobacter fuscus]|uniref:DNA 3'-5' helicase n=1 Tax=Sandarakinorhabdus fusca TaxID=1439888 RepID=A0A7C9KYS5_9SPHN|nr:UvrD-helicase domain-containing protein [Polymorphobacter fuscus]KAB7646111.1 AAA family ATPase [Polymorphobacter fuscus]MQT17308.1 AAA family ATPase [Polymorphobacter fuscus]NJC10159.1 hypothetical protein [Polymorphobacter fuscus]
MTLLYASTFTDALGRLAAPEQKQAKLAAFDLQLDPRGNGLQMHRIEKAPGFWSVRVSGDLRIILYKEGETTLLAYVDHHDAAYWWAERKRVVAHERTGAMQFVEMPIVVDAAPVVPTISAALPIETKTKPAPASYPFSALTDDQMLDVGVPRDWLKLVRETKLDDVVQLYAKLPAEAAEALTDYATGGRLEDHIAVKAVDADPFTHPDAQRRFRTVDNIEELRAALDQPFEKWAVFLHPAQRALVERKWSGPARVAGSAGTGKTIVALHRAVHLAREDEGAHVLLTTFSKSLATALEGKLHILTEAEIAVRSRVTVRALDQAAYELFSRAFGQPNLATASQVQAAIKAALDADPESCMTAEFLFDEWDEVVDAWQVSSEAAYAEVPRIGRKTRLGLRQRTAAWAVFDFVRERLAQRKLTTWPEIYGQLSTAAIGKLPFTHIVVDEAQDLTVPQARFLAKAGEGRSEALFFAGDLGQRIFHLPFSWAKLGIDVRGRSHCLKVCYRTSHQIRVSADRLLPATIADMDGVEDGRRGTVSVFDGPVPSVSLFADQEAEIAGVAKFIETACTTGAMASEVAVLVRGNAQLKRARAAISMAGFDPRNAASPVIALMHDVKGLEFKSVAVMACDEDALPDPERLRAVGDDADLATAYDTERHLLYVACTRARDGLMVSAVRPGSEFLDDLRA